jgi:hypothetical protein
LRKTRIFIIELDANENLSELAVKRIGFQVHGFLRAGNVKQGTF